jgi:hypothetical protein
MTQFQVGSISTGTLRPEDLLPTFARELERHAPDHALVTAANDILDRLPDEWDGGGASELINDIQDALQEHCPPFVTFGSHPGDGADFGFWPDMESLEEAMQYVQIFPDEVQADYGVINTDPEYLTLPAEGVIVHVTDHGNVTVMDMDRNVLWAVV